MRARWFTMLICLMLIVACGDSSKGINTSVATITPLDGASTTAIPSITITIAEDPLVRSQIDAGKAAIATNDFENAVNHYNRAYALSNNSLEVGLMLGQTYRLWGILILEKANNNPEQLRNAYDKFITGQKFTVSTDSLYDELKLYIETTSGTLNTLQALAAYRLAVEQKSDLNIQRQYVNEAQSQYNLVLEKKLQLPNSIIVHYDVLMALATVIEQQADGSDPKKSKQEQWREALNHCSRANDLWPGDVPEDQTARDCMKRLDKKLNPPPTPTSVALPTKDTRPKLPRAEFRQGYSKGSETGSFNSCFQGRVINSNGVGMAGAVGNVNNGKSSVPWTTNGNGEFSVCGLGWSWWAGVLFYVPGHSGYNLSAATWLNGASDQRAYLVFVVQ
ncbi:MAG: hypothetical protein LCH85_04290 [Chloroflexi bacterium]|nr:hypothetical protein [Chloroflexota bacterium]